MSANGLLRTVLLAVALMFSGYAMAQQDPTIHQVYAAAQAGRLDEAQSMMSQVLRDHPNSAKAHYVDAELLAKQGRMAQAQEELHAAQRLAPGLPFANPSSVHRLEARLDGGQPGIRTALPLQGSAAPGGAFPLAIVIVGLGMLAVMVLALRFMSRRGAPQPASPTRYGSIMPGAQPYPAAQPYAGGNANPFSAPAGGGLGSGIVGGLATGAAMGAGLAAGEALVHHFSDGRRNNLADSANQVNPASFGLSDPLREEPRLDDDLGGNDFGIGDDSSWDDGSSAGGDSWD